VLQNFATQTLLDIAGAGRFIREYKRGEVVFSQDQPADAVFYVRDGVVQLTATSKNGDEAVIGLPGAGEFFGEGCLAGQAVFTTTATAKTDATIVGVEKTTMMQALRDAPVLSDLFLPFLLSRHIQLQAKLSDHLFDRVDTAPKAIKSILKIQASVAPPRRR